MCNAIQQCLAANNILLMHKGNCAFLLLAIALASKWQITSLPKGIHLKSKLSDQMIKQLLPVSSSLLPQRQLLLLSVTLKIASFFQILWSAGIGQGMGAGNIFNE